MKFPLFVGPQLSLYFSCATLFAILVLGLPGCASNTTDSRASVGEAELLTDSDDSEGRKRARLRLELALGYFERGQTKVALDELKQSMAADPLYGEAHNLRGLIYMRLNDYKIAESSFRRALEISPKDSNVLHNLGWLMCQQAQYADADLYFNQALSNPKYQRRAKTFLAQGLCQVKAGANNEGAASFVKSYAIEPDNPITSYNLATLLFNKQDTNQAQVYVRRLNNSEFANAESLWLGIKVEQRMNNPEGVKQLGLQLLKRFPKSNEVDKYQRRAFNE
jgi:type IV pilus assembly protein PilF